MVDAGPAGGMDLRNSNWTPVGAVLLNPCGIWLRTSPLKRRDNTLTPTAMCPVHVSAETLERYVVRTFFVSKVVHGLPMCPVHVSAETSERFVARTILTGTIGQGMPMCPVHVSAETPERYVVRTFFVSKVGHGLPMCPVHVSAETRSVRSTHHLYRHDR